MSGCPTWGFRDRAGHGMRMMRPIWSGNAKEEETEEAKEQKRRIKRESIKMHREVKVSANRIKSAHRGAPLQKEKNRPTPFYCMKSQRPTQKMLEMQNVCLPTSLT